MKLKPVSLIERFVRPRTYVSYPSLMRTLCTCIPSRLCALPIINILITNLRTCLPLSSSISALRLFVSSCYKYRCVCQPLCNRVNKVTERPWTHVKMRTFSLRPETSFLGKFGPKKQNCLSKLKFVTQTNSEYTEFNGDVHFFYVSPEIPFLGKFGPKNQKSQFESKFGTYTNLNMQNTMVVFTFSIFHLKYLFLEQIWFKKSKLLIPAEIVYLD